MNDQLAKYWAFSFILFFWVELAAQSCTRKLSCIDWHKTKLLKYTRPLKGAFFLMYAYLVQVTSSSQNPVSVFCKDSWPHPERNWPLTTVFYHFQLNVVDSSSLCKLRSWWTFIIPHSGRPFPEIKIFLGLVCDSFWITVTILRIKLKAVELVSSNTLVLV